MERTKEEQIFAIRLAIGIVLIMFQGILIGIAIYGPFNVIVELFLFLAVFGLYLLMIASFYDMDKKMFKYYNRRKREYGGK